MQPEQLAKSGTEFGEQSALFCWLNSAETRKRFPDLYNKETKKVKAFAIYGNAGNDGDKKTAAIRGARAKQTGSQSGVADIFLPLARHGVHGLFIELKIDPANPAATRKKGQTSPAQVAFGRQVQGDGFGWVRADGWKAARAIIEQYMG